jgi:hypothetical protein
MGTPLGVNAGQIVDFEPARIAIRMLAKIARRSRIPFEIEALAEQNDDGRRYAAKVMAGAMRLAELVEVNRDRRLRRGARDERREQNSQH